MSITNGGVMAQPNRARPGSQNEAASKSGGTSVRDAIDLDDEFDQDDELMLDDETEQSLLRIEQDFHQTQRQSQYAASQAAGAAVPAAAAKRPRSPSGEDGAAGQHRALSAPKVPRRDADGMIRTSSNGTAAALGNKSDLEDLLRQLAQREDEIKSLRINLRTKEGEVTVLRENHKKDMTEYATLMRINADSIAEHRAVANQFRQTNEELVAENKSLKAFRTMEANTNLSSHVWNSVSASLARRRANAHASSRKGDASDARDYSQSHSQSMAASVGLTTPTRRNRNATNRNLGSPSSHDNSSPSSRRKGSLERRRLDHGSAENGNKTMTTSKKPTFPSFVNSFAKPLLVKETQPNGGEAAARIAVGPRRDVSSIPDEEVFLDRGSNLLQPEVQRTSLPSSQRNEAESAQEQSTDWPDCQLRYLWAVKTYTQRQGALASLILAHTSDACPTTERAQDTSTNDKPSQSTFQRLLHCPLPSDCSSSLRSEYDMAAYTLLTTLSQGTAMDAEDRFKYLQSPLDEEEHIDGEDVTGEERKRVQQRLIWECLDEIEQGVDEVLEGVVTSLRIMMAVAYKVGEFERVYDVLKLLYSIGIEHANATSFMVVHLPQQLQASKSEQEDDRGDAMDEEGDADRGDVAMHDDTQQHDAAASLQRRQRHKLDLDLAEIVAGCIRFASSTATRESVDGMNRTGAMLLDANVAVTELLVAETTHNDANSIQCTHKLKAIFEGTNTLASMLDAKRASPSIIQRVLNILTFSCQHDSLWRVALACRCEKSRSLPAQATTTARKGRTTATGPVPPSVLEGETGLFEVLAKLLVDGRLAMDEEALHAVHLGVVVFLSQLAICRPDDGMPLIVGSGALLATFVKCLQLDTDVLWNYESMDFNGTQRSMMNCLERACADLRLIAYVFGSSPMNEQTLARKLAAAHSQLLLNGIRHFFIVALSRVAFASEPSWMIEEGDLVIGAEGDDRIEAGAAQAWAREQREKARAMLNVITDVAAELLELILSPDEMESCWEALVEDDDEQDDGMEAMDR